MSILNPFNQITLVGVGLIGGSLVLDLKRKGLVTKVVGVDIHADNLARAIERKVIDEAVNELNEASVTGADLVLLATPVATLPLLCARLAPLLDKHTIVADVGSTKQSALQAFETYLPQHFPRCVATHPIAGSDRHGALAAQFGLFEHKKLILCPHQQQHTASFELVEKMWQAVGAQTYCMPATEHDAIFAAVSHLPHLLAYAYVHQIATHPQGETYLNFAGSGFRDFTRIASSHPAIWTDITLANRDSLLALLNGYHQQLIQLEHALQQQDADALSRYFTQAKTTRDDWQDKQP